MNFFDYSSALSFFKKCEKNKYWIGTIHIRLNNLSNPAVLDFVKEILSDYEVEIYECKNQITNLIYSSNTKSYEIVVYIPDVNTIDFTQRILDDCILVNTYLKYYFLERKYFASYFIVDSLYQVDYNVGLYNFDEPDDVKALINQNNSKNCLVINDLVKINTEADEENVDKFCCYRNVTYWKYDYSYNNLRENLLKRED